MEGMNIVGGDGELCMTLQIKRAATGKTEEHKLVFKPVKENKPSILQEASNGSHTLNGGA